MMNMTRFWLAGLCFALLAASGAAMAQTAAAPAATPPAAAPARVAAPAAPAAAPAPAGTTAAPPAGGGAGDWSNYNPYSGEENDLNNPNRTQDEIIAWSQQRATEVLSFAPDNIDTKMTANKKAFTTQGLGEYQKYLADSKLADMVHQQGYSVTTILNGDAMILNSGAMAGNYHWLVELPLMVTFLHTGQDNSQEPVAGGNFKLILQLGRVATNQGGVDGMAIESWKMENKATATP
jgi:hypothetical protein